MECTPRVNSSVNWGFWVIMTGQNRFIKCTTVVRDADRGEDGTCVGAEGIWELYFLLSSAVNLILFLKRKKTSAYC